MTKHNLVVFDDVLGTVHVELPGGDCLAVGLKAVEKLAQLLLHRSIDSVLSTVDYAEVD